MAQAAAPILDSTIASFYGAANTPVAFGAKRTCTGRHYRLTGSRMTHLRHGRLRVVAAQTSYGHPFRWSHFLAVIGKGWRWRGRNNETTRVHLAARRRGRLAAGGARAAASE